MAQLIFNLDDLKKIVTEILGSHCEFCYLMGSAATERFNQNSDIDIAVYWSSGELDFSTKSNFINELEARFNRDVDLISLNKIDVIFGFQVLATGRLLINHNSRLHLEWTINQMSRYPDFKISREVIEKNILNRKKYV